MRWDSAGTIVRENDRSIGGRGAHLTCRQILYKWRMSYRCQADSRDSTDVEVDVTAVGQTADGRVVMPIKPYVKMTRRRVASRVRNLLELWVW